jgi:hypothetical protein
MFFAIPTLPHHTIDHSPGLIQDNTFENITMESPIPWPIFIGPAQQAGMGSFGIQVRAACVGPNYHLQSEMLFPTLFIGTDIQGRFDSQPNGFTWCHFGRRHKSH